MKGKKMLILGLLALVLLVGGANLLYLRLSQGTAHNQLVSQTGEQTEETEQTAGDSQEDSQEAPQLVAAPDFTAYDGEGNPVNLSDYLGKPVVLNFWASWCGPCQSEMPDFQAAYEAEGEEIQFLMVNITDGARETVETASDFLEETGYTFPVLYDQDSDGAMTYGVYSLPTTYFIDADGNAVAQAKGAIDADTLEQGLAMIRP